MDLIRPVPLGGPDGGAAGVGGRPRGARADGHGRRVDPARTVGSHVTELCDSRARDGSGGDPTGNGDGAPPRLDRGPTLLHTRLLQPEPARAIACRSLRSRLPRVSHVPHPVRVPVGVRPVSPRRRDGRGRASGRRGDRPLGLLRAPRGGCVGLCERGSLAARGRVGLRGGSNRARPLLGGRNAAAFLLPGPSRLGHRGSLEYGERPSGVDHDREPAPSGRPVRDGTGDGRPVGCRVRLRSSVRGDLAVARIGNPGRDVPQRPGDRHPPRELLQRHRGPRGGDEPPSVRSGGRERLLQRDARSRGGRCLGSPAFR